jgi:hypothetical protein
MTTTQAKPQADPQITKWMSAHRAVNPEIGQGKCIADYVRAHSADGTVRNIGVPLAVLAASFRATNPDALAIARLFAGYHFGDPTLADKIAAILADPTEAEGNLRDEFSREGYDFDEQFAIANRYAEQNA